MTHIRITIPDPEAGMTSLSSRYKLSKILKQASVELFPVEESQIAIIFQTSDVGSDRVMLIEANAISRRTFLHIKDEEWAQAIADALGVATQDKALSQLINNLPIVITASIQTSHQFTLNSYVHNLVQEKDD